MPKSYTDELAEWVESRAAKKRRRDEAAVAFLAVRADVEAALASGYALVTIWEHMRETGKVKFSYETFRSHARRHIKAKPADVPAPQAKAAEPAPAPKTPEPRRPKQGGKAEKPAPAAAPTGFTFNPTPDKKDLSHLRKAEREDGRPGPRPRAPGARGRRADPRHGPRADAAAGALRSAS
nr:TraK [Cosmid vector pHM1]QBF76418.1 oriT-binding protein [Cloning vector pH3]QBF76425.1 oriT-binding protein [Protein expression vector pH3-flag]QGA70033.1 TraK [Promoter probe vector pHG3]